QGIDRGVAVEVVVEAQPEIHEAGKPLGGAASEFPIRQGRRQPGAAGAANCQLIGHLPPVGKAVPHQQVEAPRGQLDMVAAPGGGSVVEGQAKAAVGGDVEVPVGEHRQGAQVPHAPVIDSKAKVLRVAGGLKGELGGAIGGGPAAGLVVRGAVATGVAVEIVGAVDAGAGAGNFPAEPAVRVEIGAPDKAGGGEIPADGLQQQLDQPLVQGVVDAA